MVWYPSKGIQSTHKQRPTDLDIGGSNDKRLGTKKEKRLGIHETLNVAAWNVRSIGNKEKLIIAFFLSTLNNVKL